MSRLALTAFQAASQWKAEKKLLCGNGNGSH